ncbi:MAG: hypothetical protein GX796_08050 [Clostridiaceae bacterium]|nr:hypothetical protein [Clostridiaceae bacterium]
MAESYDRKISLSINDDMIKEALKLGLSSVKASDDLINRTLGKCQIEITEEKPKKISRNFMTMAYKLGAPLVAGALILVLIINGTGNFSKKMSPNMATAPQASAPQAAEAVAAESGSMNKTENEYSVSADSAAPAPIPENPELRGKGEDSFDERSGSVSFMCEESKFAMNSSISRTVNSAEPSLDEAAKQFSLIAEQYNVNNETSLKFDKENITRIYTLPESGVTAEALLEADDYHEILSGEGYWALPLKNEEGNFDVVLTVATFDINDPETPVSNRDTIYSVENKGFIVSSLENSDYIGTELPDLFDSEILSGMISEMGYELDNKAETIVVDINYGYDFIVLADTKKEKLVIPFLADESLFGVVNKRIYAWPEFVKIVSTSMGQ